MGCSSGVQIQKPILVIQPQKEVIPVELLSEEYAILTIPGTSKQIQLPILSGTLGPKMLDIRKLYQDSGFFAHDPGFMCTSSCMSTITYIDG